MIEIKGNIGKSRIFQEIYENNTLAIIIDDSFRTLHGNNVFVISPEFFDFTYSSLIDFIKSGNYYNRVMVYTNWSYEQIKPFIEWCKEQEKQDWIQYIVFYKG
jgi:hypothetical protein